jgi:hypothetical protein
VKVEVRDKFGNLLTADNSDQVTLAIATRPAGGGFASNSTTSAAVSGGIAVFGKLILNTAGNYSLAASATGGVSGPNSSSFTVSPASIGQLFFSMQPSDTTAGSAIGPAVMVEVLDAFGNALTGDNSDTVTLILNNAGKGPSVFSDDNNTMTATVNGGFATFNVADNNSLMVDSAGTYFLAASAAGGVTGAPSNPFTISPAAVSTFAVSSSASGVTAGTPFNVSIRARDMFGNTVTSYDGTATLTCSDGQAVSPGSIVLRNGRANRLITLSTPDTNGVTLTATATDAGATGPTQVTGTTKNSIMVLPDMQGFGPGTAPTEFMFTLFVTFSSGGAAGLVQPAAAGRASTPVAETFFIIAQDSAQAEMDIANQASILQQDENLAAGTMISTVDPGTGMDSVMASPVGENAFNPDNRVTYTTIVPASGAPGAAASFALTFPEGVQGVNSVADASDPVAVTALDTNGNVVTNYTGTITLSSNDPQFGQPITYTFTSADQGSHTFYVSLNTAGVQTLMVAQSAVSGRAIGSEQAASQASGSSMVAGQGLVNIMPDTPVSLALDIPATVTAGSTDGITVTALDTFGNVATDYRGTVSFSSQVGGAAFTGLPATYTFTSADQGSHLFTLRFTGTSSQTFTVHDESPNSTVLDARAAVQVAAAPAKLAIMTQPPGMVAAGSNFGLAVEAVDSHGKMDSAFNGLVTMTLAANPVHSSLAGVITVQAVNGVATVSGLTLNKAGSGYTLKATSGTLTAATSRAIRVTAGAAKQLVVIRQPPGAIAAGRRFGLKVVAEDTYGNLVRSDSGSVKLTLAGGPSGATVVGTLTAALVNGVATFSNLRIAQAGTDYSLIASGDALAAATADLLNAMAAAETDEFMITPARKKE